MLGLSRSSLAQGQWRDTQRRDLSKHRRRNLKKILMTRQHLKPITQGKDHEEEYKARDEAACTRMRARAGTHRPHRARPDQHLRGTTFLLPSFTREAWFNTSNRMMQGLQGIRGAPRPVHFPYHRMWLRCKEVPVRPRRSKRMQGNVTGEARMPAVALHIAMIV